MVEIKATTFKVFYEILCDTIIQKEYVPRNKTVSDRSLIWNIFKNEVPYPFKAHWAYNYKYFKIKMAELDPDFARKGRIVHAALFKALVYIGVNDPKVNRDDHNDFKGAKALLSVFEKEHYEQIRILDDKYPTPFETTQIEGMTLISQTGFREHESAKVIFEYLSHLNSKNYDRAWSLISHRGTAEWQESFSDFVSEHQSLEIDQAKNIYCADLGNDKVLCHFVIKYSIEEMKFKEQLEIEKITLANIDQLPAALKRLKESLLTNGFKGLDRFSVADVFEPGFAKYLALHFDPPEKLDSQLFAAPTKEIRCERLFYFECSLDRGKWMIDHIYGFDGRGKFYNVPYH